MLYKHAPFKTCVLCGSSIEEAKLNREFIVDLLQLIPSLTHEAVAVDLLRGAVCRETITRIFSPAKYPISQWFSSSATINVVASIVLRPKIRISSGRGGRAWWLTDGQRDKILGLLHEYGVGCASGECCGLVKRSEAASVKRLVAV